MNRYNIFVKILQERISKPPVRINNLVFSKNIVHKYDIFRNSGRLPLLIFLRLFSRQRVNKKINISDIIFINNNIKNFYMVYPDVFWQFCSYFPIIDKNITQKTANIVIQEQGGIVSNITSINNTIPHEYLINKYYGIGYYRSSISTTTVGAPGITLHSIYPTNNNYLQRFVNIRNRSPEFNKPIYLEIQYLADEKHLSTLLKTKKNRSIVDKNISQVTSNTSIPGQDRIVNNANINAILHEHITNKYYESRDTRSFSISSTTIGAPGIILPSINPIISNYLQRFTNIGPKFNKPKHPKIQYFTGHFFRLSETIKDISPFIDKNIYQNTTNIPIPELSGIYKNNTNINNTIPLEYITNKYYETGDDISFPISNTTVGSQGITLHPIIPIVSNYFQRFINTNAGPKFTKSSHPKTQYFTNKDNFIRLSQTIKKNRSFIDINISQKTANISIQEQGAIYKNNKNNSNINNIITHEYITNKYYETGDDISFPISNMTFGAQGITLHPIIPIVSNYLQRFININTSPKSNKPNQLKTQYFTSEDLFFRLLHAVKKIKPITDKKVSIKTANISIPEQGGIINNINDTIPHEHITNKYYKSGDFRSFPISTTTIGAPEITVNLINPIVGNPFKKINNNKFIGSKIIYPLKYGLDPLLNEQELFNRKIFPIQDIDLTYPSGSVRNIPALQNVDIIQEKIENIPAGSIKSTKINESLKKESFEHRPVHEIHMIAEKVYKIIEKKISVEKDRRGLF